ncbi:hypothetical protein FACS1894130_02990 [Spirochaetia bacterium]|nr:hypothetical protein FACS1894130_02990 [Spirochaetia bacterium]
MKKEYFIEKNIDVMKNELNRITGNSGLEDIKNNMEIFHGEIVGNKIFIDCDDGNNRLHRPKLIVELIEVSEFKTKIEVKIIASLVVYITEIICIIIFIYLFYFSNDSIQIEYVSRIINHVIKSFLIILIPAINEGHYFYHLRNMLDDIELYIEGYYDKYMK